MQCYPGDFEGLHERHPQGVVHIRDRGVEIGNHEAGVEDPRVGAHRGGQHTETIELLGDGHGSISTLMVPGSRERAFSYAALTSSSLKRSVNTISGWMRPAWTSGISSGQYSGISVV